MQLARPVWLRLGQPGRLCAHVKKTMHCGFAFGKGWIPIYFPTAPYLAAAQQPSNIRGTVPSYQPVQMTRKRSNPDTSADLAVTLHIGILRVHCQMHTTLRNTHRQPGVSVLYSWP